MQAIDLTLDEQHLREVVESIAAVDSDDNLVIDLDTFTAAMIRDDDEYAGIRIGISAKVHSAKLSIKLDVSTGDPIGPTRSRSRSRNCSAALSIWLIRWRPLSPRNL